jgi:FKBP-type peptidyl-prolyl cis-trans isomerase (trigger factor)
MPETKNYTLTKVSSLPNSEALITGEISLPFLVECRSEAIKSLNENTSLPGFRAGKIPEEVLVSKLGEMSILEEAAEISIGKEYRAIIEESKIDAIGRPHISITKLVPGSPLEFKIEVAVRPVFDLPDYTHIAKKEFSNKEKEEEVSDKEVSDVVAELEKRGINPELKEGEKLEDVVKDNLQKEKIQRAKETKRLKLIEVLVKETKIEVPKVLVEAELSKMIAQFKGDVENMGVKWLEYLEKAKKSEEEIRKEWQEQALSRVKAEMILSKISEKETIEPTPQELEHEVNHLLSHYPDSDPMSARMYVYGQLRNQKVFEFLEGLSS